MKSNVGLFVGIVLSFVFVLMFTMWNHEIEDTKESVKVPFAKLNTSSPPCLQVYNSIQKYAKKYNVPLKYAYGIAYKETHYCGPFHWEYNQRLGSSAGALGAMQIMPSTAQMMWKGSEVKVTDKKILTDIDFNVETSMKLCRHLYDKYGDWKTVFGCYNTGRPMINDYAIDVYQFDPVSHWK